MPEGKKASGKKEKLERESRKEGKEEGSNTPVGQRPGEFSKEPWIPVSTYRQVIRWFWQHLLTMDL